VVRRTHSEVSPLHPPTCAQREQTTTCNADSPGDLTTALTLPFGGVEAKAGKEGLSLLGRALFGAGRKEAATGGENAINPTSRPYDTPFRDPGIVESRIPRATFDRLFAAPVERNYPGFSPNPINSTEIPMRTQQQFEAFNRYTVP